MIYEIKHLKKIFIRAQDKNNKWVSISVHEASKKQFEHWLISRFSETGKPFWKSDPVEHQKDDWSDKEKLALINWLSKQGATFYMLT